MSGPIPIDSNPVDMRGANVTRTQGSVGKFDSVFDGLSAAAGYAGPVAATTMYYKGNMQGGDIISAAVNSTAGYPGSNYGASYGGVGMQGLTKPQVGGNISFGGNMGMLNNTGGTDPIAQADSMIASNRIDTANMLMVQQTMQHDNITTSTITNVLKSKDDMNMNVIRNLRVG